MRPPAGSPVVPDISYRVSLTTLLGTGEGEIMSCSS
jgi:hypothetical protein